MLVLKPNDGEYINSEVEIELRVKSNIELGGLEIYFNDTLLDSKTDNLGKEIIYKEKFNLSDKNLQNLMEIKVVDKSGNEVKKRIILFNLL